jgi:hypothetical protein
MHTTQQRFHTFRPATDTGPLKAVSPPPPQTPSELPHPPHPQLPPAYISQPVSTYMHACMLRACVPPTWHASIIEFHFYIECIIAMVLQFTPSHNTPECPSPSPPSKHLTTLNRVPPCCLRQALLARLASACLSQHMACAKSSIRLSRDTCHIVPTTPKLHAPCCHHHHHFPASPTTGVSHSVKAAGPVEYGLGHWLRLSVGDRGRWEFGFNWINVYNHWSSKRFRPGAIHYIPS